MDSTTRTPIDAMAEINRELEQMRRSLRPIDPMALARALDLSGKASERQRCFHCGESRFLYELTLEQCGKYFCVEDCGDA